MKKSITIQIPEPCHEDWNKMTETEKGKFCGVCTKEVFDFTASTDEDLVKFLSKNKNACGRFKKNQLGRELKLERKSGLSIAPYAASLLLPLSLLSTTNTLSKDSNAIEKPYFSLGIGPQNKVDRAIVKIEGNISDTNGNPLADVRIKARDTGHIVFSDNRGNYSIKTIDNDVLFFEVTGYRPTKKKLRTRSENIDITLEAFQTQPMISSTLGIPSLKENKATKISKKDSVAITITGNVIDDTGLPLPGVNITIKDSDKGTQSDFDGNYSIAAKPNQILIFSYVGFVSKEITLSNISNTIDIVMNDDSVILGGEIVITGGISYEEWGHVPRKSQEERDAERAAQKAAYKKEIAYTRIKIERKKAARKLKRAKRKK